MKYDLKINLLFVAFTFFAGLKLQAGIVPGAARSNYDDTLNNYQWALSENGVQVIRDVTDIVSKKVSGQRGLSADIDILSVDQSQLKKIITVAVIDSGIDYNHPDLIHNLAFNKSECIDGKIPFQTQDDKDSNGYKGDCLGWNFTVPKDDNLQNNPEDDLGHGTHVAGILAAEINNRLGVSGVSNLIKILPLKVTSKADSRANSNAALGLTSRVIQALSYARKMQVDVINISMGWPAATDSPELRKAFQDTIEAGIPIVAAAGNNNNTSFNFPCAYQDVICVGAVGIDNVMTRFSNYGGHVDLSAPGEEILSTYPTAIIPSAFSIKGYETINGTSQAAPFVSAAVALLKAKFPSIGLNEIKARLFLGSQKISNSEDATDEEQKYSLFGTLKIGKSLNLKQQSVLIPLFKYLSQVVFDPVQMNFQLPLSFKNLWLGADDVKITIKILDSGINLSTEQFSIAQIKSNEVKTVVTTGQIQNKDIGSHIKLQVTVSSKNSSAMTFTHSFELVRNLEKETSLTTYKIQSIGQQTAAVDWKSVYNRLLTVYDPIGFAKQPSYYWSDNKSGKIIVHIIKKSTHGFGQATLNLENNNISLLNITQAPLWNNGQILEGYWVGTIQQTVDSSGKTTKNLQYSLISDQLQTLQTLSFNPETVVLDNEGLSTLQFLQQKNSVSRGSTLVPVFMTTGKIPTADKDPDSFNFEVNNSQKRIFYLQTVKTKTGFSYVTRNFDNYLFYKNLRSELGLSYQDDLKLIKLLPQSKEDLNSVSAIYSYGRQDFQKYIIIKTQGDWLNQHSYKIISTNYSSAFLNKGVVTPLIELQEDEPIKNKGFAIGLFLTPIKAQNYFFENTGRSIAHLETLTSSSGQDLLISFIQSFKRGLDYFTFIQSKSNLIAQGVSHGKQFRSEASIHRATWPGVTSSELLSATAISKNGEWQPAIYVDATLMYSNHVYFWTVGDEGEILAPAKLNLQVPNGCRSMSPQKLTTDNQSTTSAIFFCISPQGAEFRLFPLQI